MAIMSMMGQILAWAWLYKFIQKEGRDRGVRSLSSLVAEKAGAPEAKLAAVLSVLFLSIYAAAQLTSGGKALLVMMGWPELVGILIGFVLVVAYCYAGGIRASIWTDAVQSCVMIVGSLILCWIALGDVGGFSGLNAGLESQDPALTNIMPPNLIFGLSLWAFAFFLGGLAVAGQPQVVSRVMTLGSDKDRKEAMLWFFVWQTPFLILMTFIGLASRVIFSENDFDPELGLPMLAMDTMPAIGVGMILASIFAATMSTADSQVLACTAAITDDIKPEWRDDHKTTKKVTLFVAAFATAISVAGLYVPGGDSVFALVVLAVYGLGGVFVPLLIIRWAGYKPDTTHSISMMVAAFAGVIGWTIVLPIMGFSWSGADGIFPSVPGMGAAFAVHFWLCWKREESVDNPFGRYSIPTKKFTTIGAVILLAFVGGMEGSYQVFAPDSTSSVDEIGSYEITGEITYHEITSGSEYILDGEDTMLEMEISGPEDDGEFSMLNIVGVRATLTYTDDEQSPAGCGSAEDSVSGHLMYSDLHATEEVNSGAAVEILWYNSSIIGTTVSDMSKTDIIGMLENEDYLGFGDHFLQISVDVNKGDCIDPFRETSDDGEDVSYLWELMTLDYSITMV
jgi:sodium/proline symporter